MATLNPWAYGPFELILHAEMHLRAGNDFDRRMALISFDNAIEVSITTYLSLNPIQRGKRDYKKDDVEKWLYNFHTKLDFFELEIAQRSLSVLCERSHIVYYHDVRNNQYHHGNSTIPLERDLKEIRKVAIWVFSVLFSVPDVEVVIEQEIAAQSSSNLPERTADQDKLIDSEHDVVEIAGQLYYASEVLYGMDPVAYSELAAEIADRRNSRGGQS